MSETDTLSYLQKECAELTEAIRHTEYYDLAATRHYTYLVRKRKAILRAIKKIEKLERKYNK